MELEILFLVVSIEDVDVNFEEEVKPIVVFDEIGISIVEILEFNSRLLDDTVS